MSTVLLNSALVLVLVIIQGIFVAAEMALVSLRDSQVRQLAHRGKRGRTVAQLNDQPEPVLLAVQIGVTLFGFLSAAFGGAGCRTTLSPLLVDAFGLRPSVRRASSADRDHRRDLLRRDRRRRADREAACAAAHGGRSRWRSRRWSNFVAPRCRPVIWLLGVSTNVWSGCSAATRTPVREEVSDEEIRALVSGSTTLCDEERQIVDDVFSAGERGACAR